MDFFYPIWRHWMRPDWNFLPHAQSSHIFSENNREIMQPLRVFICMGRDGTFARTGRLPVPLCTFRCIRSVYGKNVCRDIFRPIQAKPDPGKRGTIFIMSPLASLLEWLWKDNHMHFYKPEAKLYWVDDMNDVQLTHIYIERIKNL